MTFRPPRDFDPVFKALADPARRRLLEALLARDGQTLGELCAHLAISRQGVSQHLELLEAANLIAAVRRGREKLHLLNPAPLQQLHRRWLARFDRPRQRALAHLKRRLETHHG